jgi:hypothetical protein
MKLLQVDDNTRAALKNRHDSTRRHHGKPQLWAHPDPEQDDSVK